jgi:hypothetical protein
MKKYYEFSFEITHDYGKFFKRVVSWNKSNAVKMLMEMENCPKRAIEYVNKKPITI